MNILGIETSGLTASVAIGIDDEIICEYSTNYKKTHSVTLMPMIEEIFKAVDLDIEKIDLIAVSSGPGSFTGLRIGSSSAKGLAHALNIPIASIPTLEALANNIDKTDLLICPLMDARRNQVYTGLYEYEDNEIKGITDMMAVEITEIIEIIMKMNREVIFLGDGFLPNIDIINRLFENSDKKYYLAKPQNMLQRASSAIYLGRKYARENKLDNYLEHAPIYLRKPQAEINLNPKFCIK